MTITRRRIGTLEVGALGLGCMGMSPVYGRPDIDEAIATIHRALDIGVTLLDTSDLYGNGGNEKLLGRALRGRREEAVIATKFGIIGWPGIGLPRGLDGRPERVARCADASLSRLGVDVIDLYYLHRIDPRVPVEETVGAMAQLVAAGKVRQLGVSEATGDQLRRAHAVHPIAALQSEWSVFTRYLEDGVLPVARELGVTVVPYSPLGRGMLTGDPAATRKLSVIDYRRMLPRWRGENLEHNLALVERIRHLATQYDATPGQVALAWLLQQGEDVVPIPGTKHPRWLDENAAATNVELDADTVAELNTMTAAGTRYPEGSSSGMPS
jgi:aryl-alcohol dehydrogenase-like predicted oxidoreductase